MENMFSNKTEKKIPKTLNDCVRADDTVSNLHFWAERIESWGAILFIALIALGSIITIVNTIEAGDISGDLVAGAFLTSAISWALYAFIEYCTYHVLALLISALASITQHTIISANVALLEAAQHPEYSEAAPATAGKASYAPRPGQAKLDPTIQKKCWACDTVQSAQNHTCINCGETI